VIANAKRAWGLPPGSIAPDFVLPNAVSKPVSLSGSLERGPVSIIRSAQIDPNYTLRMNPEAILAALKDMREQSAG
jgi:hypothetical protein